MRVLPRLGAAAVAVAATVMLAPAAFADAPGDNGTVKIHDAKTGEALVKNEPHVCTFYLDAFFFDGEQEADWQIFEKTPTGTKDKAAASGQLMPGTDGHGRTADMTLADGHYKLVYNFTGERSEAAKHKVFWVDCPADSGSGGTTTGGTTDGGTTTGSTDGGTTSGSTDGGGTVSGGVTDGGTTGGTSTPTVDDTASPSPTSGTGNLAETGASVVAPTALAAVLLAAGVVFTVRFRRKGAQRH